MERKYHSFSQLGLTAHYIQLMQFLSLRTRYIQICMGEPAFLSDEFSGTTKADPDVELVSTSGKFFLNQPMSVRKPFFRVSALPSNPHDQI